ERRALAPQPQRGEPPERAVAPAPQDLGGHVSRADPCQRHLLLEAECTSDRTLETVLAGLVRVVRQRALAGLAEVDAPVQAVRLLAARGRPGAEAPAG